MNKLLETVLDEKKFPYEGMTLDERNSYLNIINHCKDVCDSIYKVNGISKCQILEMRFKKNGNQVRINGIMSIGTLENRCIDGFIFLEKDSIIVDALITRILKEGNFEYRVLDEFSIVDEKLVRKSFYNQDMQIITEEINDSFMKGMIK